MINEVSKLNSQFQFSQPEQMLSNLLKNYPQRIALASSLGAEDQVLTDIILKINPAARIFILDTGRLHQETYDAIQATMTHYGMHYEIYAPDPNELESLVRQFGPNLFYNSVADRKKCCQVRKIAPLQRVLRTLDLWVTGLRREQAVTRTEIEKIEWDEANQLIKVNPLADWTTEQVWQYIRENKVPYNKLHDREFPSIGCAPCTRAIEAGEDLRAGRWWWEAPEHKECGLHTRKGN